jgi:CubicO group peptidase (beta-lactamase class C family)
VVGARAGGRGGRGPCCIRGREAPRPGRFAELDLQALPDAGAGAAPADLAALRARIREIVGRNRAPGAAVALVGPRGELLIEGFGQAGEGRAMDGDSLFRVGSITKSFISLAVMRLVEQGKLRLEDRVQALAPELDIRNPFERTHPLRVAHLLEHTSGFDEMRFNEIVDDAPAPSDHSARCWRSTRARGCRAGSPAPASRTRSRGTPPPPT